MSAFKVSPYKQKGKTLKFIEVKNRKKMGSIYMELSSPFWIWLPVQKKNIVKKFSS